MSVPKIVLLTIYAVLAGLALTQGGTPAGDWGLRILGILAVVHSIEVLVFFKLCQQAGGSLPVHLLSVFFFGVLHVKKIKASQVGA